MLYKNNTFYVYQSFNIIKFSILNCKFCEKKYLQLLTGIKITKLVYILVMELLITILWFVLITVCQVDLKNGIIYILWNLTIITKKSIIEHI